MGFRHAMRDRFGAVSCPSEMIDHIGGWLSGKVSEGYGERLSINDLSAYLKKVAKKHLQRVQINQSNDKY